ncbi:hypothetical protein FOA52_012769 [Chlamydomonas sp. UWO 241]|nr:hypothetical protein FOA52_012769 [Chlamydomonas sp. UWO 241]
MWQIVVTSWVVPAVVASLAYYMGIMARSAGLPQAAGCLLAGVLCGPHALGLVQPGAASSIGWLEAACLALVGLAGGCELDMAQLSALAKWRQVLPIAACVSGAAWWCVYAALDWTLPSAELVPGMQRSSLTAAAAIGATIMMARSPASAVEAVKPNSACALLVAVVVVQQALLAVSYAFVVELTTYAILPVRPGVGLPTLMLSAHAVTLSASIGLTAGLGLGIALRPRPPPLLPARHVGSTGVGSGGGAVAASGGAGDARGGGAQETGGVRGGGGGSREQGLVGALLAVVAVCAFQLATALLAEPLLAVFVAGVVIANRSDQLELLAALGKVTRYSNAAFYGLVGATLHVADASAIIVPILCVGGARLLGLSLGCCLPCAVAIPRGTLRRDARALLLRGMVSQGGLVVALARATSVRFPEWGPGLQSLLTLVVTGNLIIGAPLLRSGMARLSTSGGRSAMHAGQGVNHATADAELDVAEYQVLVSPVTHARMPAVLSGKSPWHSSTSPRGTVVDDFPGFKAPAPPALQLKPSVAKDLGAGFKGSSHQSSVFDSRKP